MSSSSGGDPQPAGTNAALPGEFGEIPWGAAHDLVGHVLGAADLRGLRVAVALIDRWGRQLAFQRQPGTVIASSAVAIGKALAACTFDAPTRRLVETIPRRDPGGAPGRANPGLVFAAGGFPIRSSGMLVGGIGVSGASAEEDGELAMLALERAGFDIAFGE